EALLARAVEDADVVELGREHVGDLAGAVGRAVVDHEHAAGAPKRLAEGAQHRFEVLALVVRRKANDRSHVRMIAGVATTLPQNTAVSEQFELLADLLELEGEDAFRVLAYRRAATRIRETGGSIAQLALEGKAKALQGIGKTIEG